MSWVQFSPAESRLLPHAAGVYVIFYDGRPVYVGQSNDLKGRLARHAFRHGYARNFKTPWGDIADSVQLTGKYKVSRRFGDWAMWELRLIRRLRPIHNVTFVSQRVRAA